MLRRGTGRPTVPSGRTLTGRKHREQTAGSVRDMRFVCWGSAPFPLGSGATRREARIDRDVLSRGEECICRKERSSLEEGILQRGAARPFWTR